jgi:small subunit ribosomal protein S6
MKTYELVVLFHPDLEIDIDPPIAKVEKLVAQVGGKIIKRDNWGKKRLAYRVKHQDFAVYVYFDVQLEPASAIGFERNLGLTEEIMRHLMVVKGEEAQPEKKSEAKSKAAKVVADEDATEDKDNG